MSNTLKLRTHLGLAPSSISHHGQSNSILQCLAVAVAECGGELTTPTGVISSPNYPGLYAHHRRCRWLIRVEPGRRVTLTFNDFSVTGVSMWDYDNLDSYPMRPTRPVVRFDQCSDYVQVSVCVVLLFKLFISLYILIMRSSIQCQQCYHLSLNQLGALGDFIFSFKSLLDPSPKIRFLTEVGLNQV
jgi:hypothetical protein